MALRAEPPVVITSSTTTIGSSKVNDLLVMYQHFENNITANDPNTPGIQTPSFFFGANLNTPQQTIQKRIQVKDEVKVRLPEFGRPTTAFFIDNTGNASRRDPNQPEIPGVTHIRTNREAQ